MVSLGQQGATPSSFDTPIASTTIHDTMGPLILRRFSPGWNFGLVRNPADQNDWNLANTNNKIRREILSFNCLCQSAQRSSVCDRQELQWGLGTHGPKWIQDHVVQSCSPQFHLIKQTFGSCPYSHYSSTHQILGIILSHCHDRRTWSPKVQTELAGDALKNWAIKRAFRTHVIPVGGVGWFCFIWIIVVNKCDHTAVSNYYYLLMKSRLLMWMIWVKPFCFWMLDAIWCNHIPFNLPASPIWVHVFCCTVPKYGWSCRPCLVRRLFFFASGHGH